jgi:phenylalanyl-tRNA synthetase alpha chain
MSGSLVQKLEQVRKDFDAELAATDRVAALQDLKSRYTGKTGPITEVLKGLKDATVEEKRILGPVANEIKEYVLEKILKKITEIEYLEINQKLKEDYFDPSVREGLFYHTQNHGGLHPVTQVQREIEDIFLSMGFEVLDGPHIEDEFHNFEALNIPGDHPARDMQDTFWFHVGESVQKRFLLRTHTSTVQVRGMEIKKPPFKFIAPGKVFRCERTDASHEMVFHQLEGMMVGENISVSHLIYFMKTLLSEIFRKEMEVRLRPGFFPFVEPGFELDIKCLICQGKGCSVCKQVGWLELLPCGMVHPNVLKAGNIDPTKYNGFAFGLGLDRLVMMRYGIEDIRHLHSGDLRFVQQFRSY